ncbi:maleylpyruvate isomerase family mycothiol-dependent enzyme [Dactylosporangium cerinum]|uniref:Maleylpyruvate isomerase family mycothiol-dependent enzyme n=1 Tax=Dactylosporangium cerinum TaxID=1434730 RepID=A0ABV9W818_9ACTN
MRFEDHCSWIVAQTELLVSDLPHAPLGRPVPSCPDWTLGALLRHIGGGHRWAAGIVRTRATGFLPDGIVRDVAGDDTGEVPAGWLLDGAHELATALLDAGPDEPVWTPVDAGGMPFWARRFAHETLVHRADATLAAGTPFEVATDVAVDALDEWMELDTHPIHFELDPAKKEILGPGRTVALLADDLPDGGSVDVPAGWFVDLTGEVNTWRRGVGPAAVTVRAPLRQLLLMVYRRRTPDGLLVTGDEALLRHWLGHVAFG